MNVFAYCLLMSLLTRLRRDASAGAGAISTSRTLSFFLSPAVLLRWSLGRGNSS
ncbi:hypothetical protein RGU77_07265 [Actimicrobium sp. CCI2.3]|uniref:hypothetical protein n=1 Tax=Actimicrobium sp. CCI2.3 TaxID=3048616 RepID=UPI002AB5DAA5|nr:hypothetical protein [Actimicrobium sp. CCI2.3]MDY7574087.1 hypothetical protein [Actimicrobium sp. CCI2.3]MEB0023933.1 hypothetical protein [Actimicrobium sp. CCI2.3]